jgi:hypothetical protein
MKMTTHLTRSIETPIREGLATVAEIWDGPDKGLIFCWEQGREERLEKPELAARAEKGELVPVGRAEPGPNEEEDDHGLWKRGSLQYLAWWQGLRGENLKVSFVEKIEIVCPRIFVTDKGKKTRRVYFFPRRKKPSAFDVVPVRE